MRRRPPARAWALGVLAVCALFSGCTIQDMLRATLGGRDSNEAYLNKVNPKNQVSFAPDER